MTESLYSLTCLLVGAGLLWMHTTYPGKIRFALPSHLWALGNAAFGCWAFASDYPRPFVWSPAILFSIYCLLVLLPSFPLRTLEAGIAWFRTHRWRMVATSAILAAAPVLGIYLVGQELESRWEFADETILDTVADGNLQDSGVRLRTDRGREITAMKSVLASEEKISPANASRRKKLLTDHRLHDKVIEVPEGWEQNCNCHGWVFSGGKYWIQGRDVPKILTDNFYIPVNNPRSGDVIVYRDSNNEVMHTGVVRGYAGPDVVLVESKWGAMGRFIHRHDQHCYVGVKSTFYRSFRAGHRLRGIPFDDPATYPSTELLHAFHDYKSSPLEIARPMIAE